MEAQVEKKSRGRKNKASKNAETKKLSAFPDEINGSEPILEAEKKDTDHTDNSETKPRDSKSGEHMQTRSSKSRKNDITNNELPDRSNIPSQSAKRQTSTLTAEDAKKQKVTSKRGRKPYVNVDSMVTHGLTALGLRPDEIPLPRAPENIPQDLIGRKISLVWEMEDGKLQWGAGTVKRMRFKKNVPAKFKDQSDEVMVVYDGDNGRVRNSTFDPKSYSTDPGAPVGSWCVVSLPGESTLENSPRMQHVVTDEKVVQTKMNEEASVPARNRRKGRGKNVKVLLDSAAVKNTNGAIHGLRANDESSRTVTASRDGTMEI